MNYRKQNNNIYFDILSTFSFTKFKHFVDVQCESFIFHHRIHHKGLKGVVVLLQCLYVRFVDTWFSFELMVSTTHSLSNIFIHFCPEALTRTFLCYYNTTFIVYRRSDYFKNMYIITFPIDACKRCLHHSFVGFDIWSFLCGPQNYCSPLLFLLKIQSTFSLASILQIVNITASISLTELNSKYCVYVLSYYWCPKIHQF